MPGAEVSDSSSETADDPLIGRVLADRYRVLALLGTGGMGRVYRAEHVRIGRQSAVKVMSSAMASSSDAVARFNREAANASRITHPNVAQIYDFGESDGVLYLAMEFVDGESLRALLQRDGHLPVVRAVALTRQIADGLAAAHHLNIIHRDLKPDNVMVARLHDGSEWVKVVDFGIAKTVHADGDAGAAAGSQTLTTVGMSVGTPEYMSPEQLAGERLTPQTDQYSLALVLFTMLTGVLPYPEVTTREALVRRLTAPPQTLAETLPRVPWPAGLQSVLDRALASEPADRYPSVTEFARALVACIGPAAAGAPRGLTPTVRLPSVPVSPAPHAASRPRRVGVLVAVVAGMTTLGAAGVVGALVLARRAPAIERPARVPAKGARKSAVRVSTGTTTSETSPPMRPVTSSTPPRQNDSASAVPRHAPRAHQESSASQGRVPARAIPPSMATRPSSAAAAPPPPLAETRRVSFADTTSDVRRLGQRIRTQLEEGIAAIGEGNVPRTRTVLRNASTLIDALRTRFPAVADSIHLDRLLQNSGRQLFGSCRQGMIAMPERYPAGFTCDQLVSNPWRRPERAPSNR